MVKIVIGKKSNQGGQQKQGQYQAIANTAEDHSTIGRRVKVLEERYTNFRSRFQLMEQNILRKNKNIFTDIKTLNLEISDMKKEITEVKDNMLRLLKELEAFSKKEDVDMLRKYIDLWNPMNFVTKNDVEDIVKEVINSKVNKS